MSPAEEPSSSACPVSLFALLAARLEQLDMSHWTAVVFAWLARYDGLSNCYFEDEEDSPTMAVLRTLGSLNPGVTDSELASALASLEFLTWRIRHPDTGERWDPIVCSLTEFLGAGRLPICWKWEGVYPSHEAIQEWLLDQHRAPR